MIFYLLQIYEIPAVTSKFHPAAGAPCFPGLTHRTPRHDTV